MDLNAAQILATRLMMEHGIFERGWTLEFGNAKRRAGAADFKRKTIRLSRYLIRNNSESDVRNVVLHEIAHVLAGFSAAHGPEWQRVARSIGCDAKRTTSATMTTTGRYEIRCPKDGGHVLGHFHRRVSKTYGCKQHGGITVTIVDTQTGEIVSGPGDQTSIFGGPQPTRMTSPATRAVATKPKGIDAKPWNAGSSDWDAMWGDA